MTVGERIKELRDKTGLREGDSLKINANGTEIAVMGNIVDENAYISLTDIAKRKNSDDPRIVISNWMSSYSTIDFLATWETLYNPNFNRMEFQTVRSEADRLIMTPKQWIERMSAMSPDVIVCSTVHFIFSIILLIFSTVVFTLSLPYRHSYRNA